MPEAQVPQGRRPQPGGRARGRRRPLRPLRTSRGCHHGRRRGSGRGRQGHALPSVRRSRRAAPRAVRGAARADPGRPPKPARRPWGPAPHRSSARPPCSMRSCASSSTTGVWRWLWRKAGAAARTRRSITRGGTACSEPYWTRSPASPTATSPPTPCSPPPEPTSSSTWPDTSACRGKTARAQLANFTTRVLASGPARGSSAGGRTGDHGPQLRSRPAPRPSVTPGTA
ncbi:hypothetical protein SAFG77S_04623 [Streptomyces afghaniensis]